MRTKTAFTANVPLDLVVGDAPDFLHALSLVGPVLFAGEAEEVGFAVAAGAAGFELEALEDGAVAGEELLLALRRGVFEAGREEREELHAAAEAGEAELGELVPVGGSTREAWDAVVASLFGPPPAASANDKELAEVTKKAQKGLADAIRRFEKGDGLLYVKGPFVIPEDARADGGPSADQLWLAVASCNLNECTGTLANDPTFPSNFAPGKISSVKRGEASDWALRLRDGTTAGGESIKLLRARRP